MRLSPSAPPHSPKAFLTAQPFAHRGLHDGTIVENSRAAFRAAIDRGDGIELDVRAARDGEAIVFHDELLDRMTDESGALAHRTADELKSILLRGTDEPIATLVEILELIGGRVPILVEIKSDTGAVDALCRSVWQSLADDRGHTAVMSFDPRVCIWFKRFAPKVMRGLVASGPIDSDHLTDARPDFLAVDIADLPSPAIGAIRAQAIPILTWTVRTAKERTHAALFADQIIYEGQA